MDACGVRRNWAAGIDQRAPGLQDAAVLHEDAGHFDDAIFTCGEPGGFKIDDGVSHEHRMRGANDIRVAPKIETARLFLRGWAEGDAAAFADMNEDPRVMEFFVSTSPRERSLESAKVMHDDLEANGFGWFVMEVKGEPGFAGVIALADVRNDLPFAPAREIGWRLPVHRWNHGYATEAASALMQFGFDALGMEEIVSVTAAINLRSQRVMEKLGMTRDVHGDFLHPRVPKGHRIEPHVLYRKRR